MPSKILNFNKNRLITGINIIDGMLFFTDNETEPKKINIKKFKGDDPDVAVDHSSGTTHIYNRVFEERDITVIKEHPFDPLKTSLVNRGGGNDGTIGTGGGDVIDTSDDGYDWVNDDDDQFTGDDDEDITSSMSVQTMPSLTSSSIQRTTMKGLVTNAVNLQEKGFYYTFDNAYSSRDQMIANVGSGSFKIQDNQSAESFLNGITAIISSTSSSDFYDEDGLGAQSGDIDIYWMAYAKDSGLPGEVYGTVQGPVELIDTTATPTGTVDDFKVEATYSKITFLEQVSFKASYSSAGGMEILNKGFYVSKGYLNVPATVPTYDEVVTQAEQNVRAGQDGTGERTQFPALLGPDSLNELGQLLGTSSANEFSANAFTTLQPGYTHYVYAFIQTTNQTQGTNGTVITATPATFKTTQQGDTVQRPFLKHESVTPFTTKINLEATISSVGDQSATISEKGFLVSTTIFDTTRLKEAFPALASNGDGSSQVSGITDTYKITSSDTLDGGGLGPFTVSTDGFLTLTGGTTVYYLAYAKNASGGISYGSEGGYYQDGEIGRVDTVSEDTREPVIILNDIGFRYDATDAEYKINFDYDISFMPNGVTPVASGIVFSLPSRGEIIEANAYGFQTHAQVAGSRKMRDIPSTDFTFTSSGDSTFLGNYKITDYEYPNYDEEDERKWLDVYNFQDFLVTFLNPLGWAMTSYAYVVGSDGKETKSALRIGGDKQSDTFGDWGLDTGVSSFNMSYAPTIQTRNNAGKVATDVSNTGLTIEGRFADNSAGLVTPMLELGFYYSTTDRPAIPEFAFNGSTEYHDALDTWIAKSSTTKVTLTITSAMQSHATGQDTDGVPWYEFDKTLTGLTAGSTVYFVAFCKPTQRSTRGIYAIPMYESLNKNSYGAVGEQKLIQVFSEPQSGEEPYISMGSANIGNNNSSGASVTFEGAARANANYYTITQKGFYYKPVSVIGASATSAQIKTAMASSASRTTLLTSGFSTATEAYGYTDIVPEGEYYVSAFCQTTTNGNTDIYISPNYKKIDVDALVVPQVTKPILTTKTAGLNFPRLLNGAIIDNNIDISERGFYIIGKSGSSFSKPSSGTALKSQYDSPPSGVITHKINDADGLNVFYKTFTNQKRGYTYYYTAYAKNNSNEEGIAQNVAEFFDAEQLRRLLIASTSLINIGSDGAVEMYNNDFSYGDSALVRIKTENGYDGNWRISSLGNWSGTSTPVRAYKRINNGEAKLSIPTQSPNGIYQRTATIRITHGSDSSLSTTVRLSQSGSEDVFFNSDNIYDNDFTSDLEDLFNQGLLRGLR